MPLEHPGDDFIRTGWTVRLALDLVNAAMERGSADYGPVLHWAHLFKALQGPDGLWPARIAGRTGEAVGSRRTREPLRLLRLLRDALGTTEFDQAIARSQRKGESNGIQDGNDVGRPPAAEQA